MASLVLKSAFPLYPKGQRLKECYLDNDIDVVFIGFNHNFLLCISHTFQYNLKQGEKRVVIGVSLSGL